jgi:pimeloyl-ACP methyl ester carboxylesterase
MWDIISRHGLGADGGDERPRKGSPSAAPFAALRMTDTPKRTFTSEDGVTLVGEEYGPPQGEPVIMFHGGGQARHAWWRSALKLAEHGFRVVVVDMRGHGEKSWAQPDRYERDDCAADVTAVSRQYEKPVLVGASLGGIAALTAIGESDVPGRLVWFWSTSSHDRTRLVSNASGSTCDQDAGDSVHSTRWRKRSRAYLPHRTRPASRDGLRKNLRGGHDGKWLWHWDPAFFERVDQGPGEPSAGTFSPLTGSIVLRGRSRPPPCWCEVARVT